MDVEKRLNMGGERTPEASGELAATLRYVSLQEKAIDIVFLSSSLLMAIGLGLCGPLACGLACIRRERINQHGMVAIPEEE